MSEQLDIMEQYPVLPTRSAILLPGVQAPLEVGRSTSVNAVEAAERDGVPVLVVPQRDPDTQSPSPMSLHEVGVLADVVAVEKNGPRRYTVTLRGRSRYVIDSYEATSPYLIANATPFPPGPGLEDPEVFALITELKIPLAAVLADRSGDEEAEEERIAALDDPEDLLSEAVGLVELTRDNELKLLCETDTAERLRTVLPIISRLHQVLLVKASIDAQLSSDISRGERERVLRDRMRAIKEELGEADVDSDLDELRERMDDSKMPDDVRTAAKRQLARMGHMSTSSPEYNVARTYLETLLDIPWGEYTKDTLDVAAARAILEADHAGLEKVKKRILEFIAVRKLAPDKQGPILCLVGPPGVGKTSLGRSIATSLGRKYVRISLGGVRDESEIRGHRRTYIGALPGRIANGLKKAGAMNPVFVLDEIDKLGGGMRGDPSAALLEVLDPEQNNSFSDHYLEVDLDLSRIMFLATANQLETIPAALLDRMEIIRLPGYTIEEKREIARQHLLPKQIVEHGLGRDQVIVDDEALDDVITRYTREAGVRNLERELAALCRHAAVEIAGGTADVAHIGKDDLSEPLGPPRYFSEVADRHPEVGISTGLAWTPTGGDIMFIEARSMPGKGDLKLTGQLGDVMSESAAAAYSWVRANADRLEIEPSRFTALDIHMHIPSGAVRKDGPSAGIAISTALVSLLSDKPVRSDVAITGEITLRGLSLPVGGIKEKVLAAHRAGIKVVLLPERNRKDIEDIPQEVRDTLDIRFVKKVDEALVIALGHAGDTAPAAAAPIPVVPPPAMATKSPGQVFPS